MTASGMDPYFVFDNAWSELCVRAAGDEELSVADKAFMQTVTPIGILGDVVVIAAPDEFVKTVMEQRLRKTLATHLSEIYGRPIRLAFTGDAPEAPRPIRKPAIRLADLDARLRRVEKHLGIADRVDPATMTELDRTEHVEQVRTHLREWTGYDPSPEEEQAADEAIEAALGRRGDSDQVMRSTAHPTPGNTTEAVWAMRFGRSADRERDLGITPEWLAEHKAGVEQQRSAG